MGPSATVLRLLSHSLFIQPMIPSAQTPLRAAKPSESVDLVKPAQIFDGEAAQLHEGWVVPNRG